MKNEDSVIPIVRYALPVGPGSIGERFRGLCHDVSNDFVDDMRSHVRDFLVRISELGDPRFHDNLRDAVWVAEQSYRLLDHFQALSEHDRSVAVGAIRYFIIHADSVPDFSPFTGFQDDKYIMLHALERLNLLEA